MGLIRNLMVGVLLFSGVIIGFGAFAVDLASKSGSAVSVADISALSYSTQVEAQAKEVMTAIQSAQITGLPVDYPLMVVAGAFAVLKLVAVNLVTLATGLIQSVAVYLLLPAWFVGLVAAGITLILAMEVTSSAMKWDL